jgi:uncharacterized protein
MNGGPGGLPTSFPLWKVDLKRTTPTPSILSIMDSPSNAQPGARCFFQKRDPWGQGFSLWVMALLLFLAPLAVMSLRHVRMDNNVENWLPENDPSAQEYAWCRDYFPESEKLVLTWPGCTYDDPRLPILKGQLEGRIDADGMRRGGLPYVESVVHAGDILQRMVGYGVSYEEAMRRLEGTFVGRGRIKLRLTPEGLDNFDETVRLIRDGAARRFDLHLTVHDPLAPWSPDDYQEETFEALAARFPAEETTELPTVEFGEHHLQLSWSGMGGAPETQQVLMEWIRDLQGRGIKGEQPRLVEECYIAPGAPIAVLVGLSEAGLADRSAALAAIREAAQAALIPADQLVLGGRVVAGAELNAGVLKAAWNPGADVWFKKSVILLSGLVGILFALFSLRSFRLGLLVVGIAYYAALLGMTLVPLSGGTMNMVLIVMPTLLMVLALSGAIHVANYWKHAVWEDPENAVSRATRMARQPCLMAACTTALGLVSLAGSQLKPVREFGMYAAIGSLISVVMVLYGLPALLQMAPLRRVRPDEINSRWWLGFGHTIATRWKPLAVVCLVVAVCCIAGLQHFQVETKVIKYFPSDSQLVKDYEEIEDTLAGISPVEVVVRFNEQAQQDLRFLERLEIVRQVEEELRAHPEVSGTVSLADFQPVRLAPGSNAPTREKIFFNRRSNEAEKRIKNADESGAEEFLAMSEPNRRAASLASAGRLDQKTGKQRDELWRISAQAAVLSDADYTQLTNELAERVRGVTEAHAGMDYVVTGTVPLFLRTQKAVLESLIWSFVLAFCLIAGVMICILRDPIAGALSMIPNLLPVLSVFGLVSWFGQRIDIGTMVTASVALGIAVDGTLHLLTWFRDGLCRGYSRQQSLIAALSHCGPAMWQTSAAVGLGLLVLLPADLLLISRFGWLMSALILGALIGDLVLLPCLLVGPLGRLIEYRIRKRQEKKAQEPEEIPVAGQVPPPIPAPHLPLGEHVKPGKAASFG